MIASELKEYIYNNKKIDFILEQLGCHLIVYHANKEYYSACQPDGDNPQGVNIRNNQYLNYQSYTRNVEYSDKKDIFDLVEYIKNISFAQSVKYLHQLLGLKFDGSKRAVKADKSMLALFQSHKSNYYDSIDAKEIENQVYDEEILNDYVQLPYIGWVREGIMPWSCNKFGIAYSYKKKRVIIPLRHWKTGKLLGINSRTVVENYKEYGIKKYYITPSYKKNENLFGLYENQFTIKQKGYVVIVESEKSVLKRDSRKDSTLVALSGHTLSDRQVVILKSLDIEEVVIALDKDIPIQEVRHMCEKLRLFKRVSYIYDKWGLIGDKDSPADAENKRYKFLFDHRVLYDKHEQELYRKEMERK